MADDVTLPGVASVVATDEVDMGGGAAHVQMMKLVDATDGGTARIPGSAAKGLAVEPRSTVVRKAVTPTITTSVYASGDAIGGIMEFTNAARSSGQSIRVEAVQVADSASLGASMDLVLFDRNPGSGTFTDNSPADPTDAELDTIVAVVPIGSYAGFSDNSVSDSPVERSMVLNGTSLFGVLVARSGPTYAATDDITVTLTILQD